MNDELSRLFQLKEVDDERLHIEGQINGLMKEITGIDQTLKSGSSDVAELEKSIVNRQKERDKLDLDRKTIESHVTKLKGQMLTVKTNREYEALKSEIDRLNADASRIEDRVIQAMEDIDVLNENLRRGRQTVEKGQQELEGTKRNSELQIEELKGVLATLNEKRKEMLAALRGETRAMYERVLKLRGDTALAQIDPEERICQGCYSAVTLQKISLLMLGRDLIQCERCNRFLYLTPQSSEKDTAEAAVAE